MKSCIIAIKTALFLWALAAIAPAGSLPAEMKLKEGRAFPGLSLPTTEGERLSIHDFEGRKVILHIFASW
ncbi:MAG: hypothetical protein ACYTG7_11350 [Planctomycetota bacterium]|jgi:hypothetical protein